MAVPFRVDLSGRTAVVTGGGGILCGCMAKALAECGARVAVLDLREEQAKAVATEIQAAGGQALGVPANVLDRASLETALQSVRAAFGPCHILINGAGGNHPLGTTSREHLDPADLEGREEGFKTFYDLDPKGIEFVFGLNFLGTLLPTQVFTWDMARAGSGSVVNISSMNALRPLTKIPAYSAAKAAVSNFTQWLAVHLSKVGIRVNGIAPGFFLTDQNRGLLTQPDGAMTERGRTILSHTPMGRYGKPEDLLGVLLWLCSDSGAAFVTGTVVPVDGGFSAFSGV
ncbi:MAG: SDR family oxidoreductase [Lentisphaeria bacterium]|nr:SDR family oxidoreductase [Lentisphaeria bacterium]